jgi:hypothetical protein
MAVTAGDTEDMITQATAGSDETVKVDTVCQNEVLRDGEWTVCGYQGEVEVAVNGDEGEGPCPVCGQSVCADLEGYFEPEWDENSDR